MPELLRFYFRILLINDIAQYNLVEIVRILQKHLIANTQSFL